MASVKAELPHDSDAESNDIPEPVIRRIKALMFHQHKRAELDFRFRAELVELEKKYLALSLPLSDERAAIISGTREPTNEEIGFEGRPADFDESSLADCPKGIPSFWLRALSNHPEIAALITEDDAEALRSLEDIRMGYLEGNPGFRLEFFFGANAFFTDKVLTKTYYLENPTTNDYSELLYDHAIGTEINWKTGKNLCFRTTMRAQRAGPQKNIRSKPQTVPTPSFFQFFYPPAIPKDGEEDTVADPDELDDKLQTDYELGELFKSKLVPNAVDWFTGRALQFEELDYDDEDECGSDCESDHSYDDNSAGDDSDIDEEFDTSRRVKPKQSTSSHAAPNAEAQCKQQ